MSKEMDEIRGKIIDLLYEAVDKVIMVEPFKDEETLAKTTGLWLNTFADRFLALETPTCRIAVVDREAGLPSNPYKFFDPSINEEILYKEDYKIYARAQKDILKQGWVKEIK